MDISNRWALVTGASRGVGLRVARGLAAKGCRLILHARSEAATAPLAAELRAQGVSAYTVAADLAEPDALPRLIAAVREISGDHLDILYNNAALMTPWKETFTPSVEDYQLSFQVNTIAPIKLCDAFLPGMLQRNWGRVVNVTSGIAYQPQLMPYSCSKAALDRYVRDMEPTLRGTNVLMNLLDPGWLRTDMGGPNAPNDPDDVLPGALVPVLLEAEAGSGRLYRAMDYVGRTDLA